MTTQWQPIETAPKDGEKTRLSDKTRILGFDGEECCVIYWSEGYTFPDGWISVSSSFDCDHGHLDYFEPTHWMPLPAPPEDEDDN